MPSEKVKCFYEEIKLITGKIGETGLPDKLIKAAKERDLDEAKSISRQFKQDNLELWGRIVLFYEKYREYCEGIEWHIFGDEEKSYNMCAYNPSDIDPLNLIVLIALSFGSVKETDLFEKWGELQSAIEQKGYKEIADYMTASYINGLESLINAYS